MTITTRPSVLLVDNGTLSLPQLRRRFDELGSTTDAVAPREVPATVDGMYQAIVLSGTKVRAFDQDHYRRVVDLVMTTSVPVYAICGGMQVLALAAGATLREGPSRVGSFPARVDTDEPLFAYTGPQVRVFQRHMLYLDAAPHGFVTIGASDDAPVEFIRSGDGRIHGSQSHVEFKEDGRLILKAFSEMYA